MATTDVGRSAETVASDYLKSAGFKIVARNWRNRWCELDIVATKAGVIHFVEVKYRSNLDFGSGFEYITADKLERLARATSAYVASRRIKRSYQIDVVAVSGSIDQPVVELLENVTA